MVQFWRISVSRVWESLFHECGNLCFVDCDFLVHGCALFASNGYNLEGRKGFSSFF